MPRTPPIIMPTNSYGSWFGGTSAKEKESSYDNMEDLDDLNQFTCLNSDDEESPKVNNKTNNRSEKTHAFSEEPLYHKPTSNQPSQQNTSCSNQQKYEIIDEDEDEDDQNSDDNLNVDNTQCEEDKFNATVDDLRDKFKLYADEYKEFKRHVDSAKSELLEFIQNRTLYFEERGTYLKQEWDSLRQLI
ncbi:hypothetical protein MFLAVUS_007716 [Mucor flavus]|uniref:Uncharacterized protein n=1 Tax=Mucor flavus TaxID=439312 RepID=A0ABP9Z536_9FUNG